MSIPFIHELIVRLVHESTEQEQIDILFNVCVLSFNSKSDYLRFFEITENVDFDEMIINFTIPYIVRQWWQTYILCINDEVFRKLINEKFDNEAAWLLLTTIHNVYSEQIEKHFLKFCDA